MINIQDSYVNLKSTRRPIKQPEDDRERIFVNFILLKESCQAIKIYQGSYTPTIWLSIQRPTSHVKKFRNSHNTCVKIFLKRGESYDCHSKTFFALVVIYLGFYSSLVNGHSFQTIDLSLLQREVNEYCYASPLSLDKEKILADKLIEYFFQPNRTKEELLAALLLTHKMQGLIRQEYTSVSGEALKEKGGSVGAALYFNPSEEKNNEKNLDILLQEARLMSTGAQIALNIIYKYKVGDKAQQYNPKIFEFYKDTANLGMPRSQLALGECYLRGYGVPTNEQKGIDWIIKSDLGEAYLDLASYSLTKGDSQAAKKYWEVAAHKNMPEGSYNLGNIAQQEKNYKKSIEYFQETLKLDENYHAATLELARMYCEGWGVSKNEKKCFKMMKLVTEKAEGKLRAVADTNLGLFYLNGTGTSPSINDAKKYLKRAAEDGIDEANEILNTL